jgi:PEP-CTERM motif
MKSNSLSVASAIVLLATITAARSSTVEFHSAPSTDFADGTFTSDLSGIWPDGFYALPTNPTAAFNGYGQNGEAILFNAPVMLQNLTISKCDVCADFNPLTFGISLFHDATLLTFTSIPASFSPSTLSFNLADVTELKITFAGGGDRYMDGRTVAWYLISDVNYLTTNISGVPEPSTWAMMMLGVVGLAFKAYRSKSKLALNAV